MTDDQFERAADAIARRAEESFQAQRQALFFRTNRQFFWLLLCQWMLAIVLALVVSPLAWEGKAGSTHPHVYFAVGLGALLTLPPALMAWFRPALTVTRYAVTVALSLQCSLLVHLLGGRIEAHFSFFMLMWWIAFYRDMKLIIVAVAIVAADHVLRAVLWPDSLFGSAHMAELRALEHGAWFMYGVVINYFNLRDSLRDMRRTAEGNAQVEALAEGEWRKSSVLDRVAAPDERK